MGLREEALLKLQVGSFGEEAEVLEWSYWDRLVMLNTTLVNRLFTSQLGVGGKTLADTNMKAAGQMPQGEHFAVMAIKFFYKTNAARATADVQSFYAMLAETTMRLIIGSTKDQGQWTLQELLGASNLFALTPTAAGDNIPLIQPTYRGIYLLNEPIIIGALTNFEAVIEHHVAPAAALNDDKLKISLAGILVRAS